MNAALAALVIGRVFHVRILNNAQEKLDNGVKDDTTICTITGQEIENYGLILKEEIENEKKSIKDIDDAYKILLENGFK